MISDFKMQVLISIICTTSLIAFIKAGLILQKKLNEKKKKKREKINNLLILAVNFTIARGKV